MAGYYEEFGWAELQTGEQPRNFLDMARFLVDYGFFNEDIIGQWPSLPPPASKEAVEKLPEITIESGDKSCTICLKVFSIGEKAKEMPCRHQFHVKCILTWLEKTNSCPFCRHELPTNNEAYEAYKKDKKRKQHRQEEIEALHNSMFS